MIYRSKGVVPRDSIQGTISGAAIAAREDFFQKYGRQPGTKVTFKGSYDDNEITFELLEEAE